MFVFSCTIACFGILRISAYVFIRERLKIIIEEKKGESRMKPKAIVIVLLLTSMLNVALNAMPVQTSNGGNIVVNGGFEDPVVEHAEKWDIYNSAEIPGWSVEWMPSVPASWSGETRPSDASIELQRLVFDWTAIEGSQWAELDSDWDGPTNGLNNEPASIKIYQELHTVLHGVYNLSFAFSPRPAVEENKLEVRWGGEVVAVLEANGTELSDTDWTYYEYMVIATSTRTHLEFADLSASDAVGTFLDDVSVKLKGEPTVTDLIAGQHIKAGTVLVWNDGTHLYVQYSTMLGWFLTKTHLAVATSLGGIPQTPGGNPIPGLFPYQTIHDPWVTQYTYIIELDGWSVGTNLYIAAHAVVKKTCTSGSQNVVVNGGFEEPVVTNAEDWDIYASWEISGWSVEWMPGPDTYEGYTRPSDAYIELQRLVLDWTTIEGSQWAELDSDWDGPTNGLNNEPASIKIYQDLVTVPGGEYRLKFYFSPRPNTDASNNVLKVTWDGMDIDTISLAGGSDTIWTYHTYTLTATGYTTRLEFADMGTSDALGPLLDDVRACGPTFCGCETAWGDGEDFPGTDWSMYFTHTIYDP